MADALKIDNAIAFLIVVPTQALLDQWYVSLQEDFGVPSDVIRSYSGEGIPLSPGRVNILVINTAREWVQKLSDRLHKTFLIVDECHRAGSEQNARALRGDHWATLGLSATPKREYDDALREIIIPALGPIVYEYDYASARRDGVIAPFDLVNVRIPLLPPEEREYEGLTRRIARLMSTVAGTDERLKRVLLRRASIAAGAALRVPATVKLAIRQRNARTLIFHEQIAAAEEIQAQLSRRGLNATIYHSRIEDATRRDNLRLFRRGVFDALVSCRALDEGVNVPETSVAIVASSTASGRQRIQRLGRVLRPSPGKESALIYTVYATEIEEERLAREATSNIGASSVEWQRISLPDNA